MSDQKILNQKLSFLNRSIPFISFAGDLTLNEYDILCPELGTVAEIKPSNYRTYNINPFTSTINTSLINFN